MMSSSQIGKTEGLINNTAGYHIDQDPAPMLIVMETEAKAEAWSRERLAPMLRDTPCLTGKVRDSRSRDSENKILFKEYPDGFLAIAGAGSEAELSSRAIRIVLMDELDKWKILRAGDPEMLVIKRTTTFWNRKIIRVSTPRDKSTSRILRAYERSDRRRRFLPCPFCNEFQVLVWGYLKFKRGDELADQVERAWYECAHCHAEIDPSWKMGMLGAGEWRAERPTNGHAGFWLNELYSPWVSWKEMAESFLKAKKSPETLKTFVNESLAEPWEDEGEAVDDVGLLARREEYPADVPRGVSVLTIGADVQKDYVQIEVVGWGEGAESWGIEYVQIIGDPARISTWDEVSLFFRKKWRHESGAELQAHRICIDTGAFTQHVYDFIKREERQGRRIFGTKGSSNSMDPIIPKKPMKRNSSGIFLVVAGVDAAKEQIYGYISKVLEPGPRYMHYPLDYPEEYFSQLTVERIKTKYVRGFPKKVWEKPAGARNEALDCRVLAMAALHLQMPSFKKHLAAIEARAVKIGNTGISQTEASPIVPSPPEPGQKAPQQSKFTGKSRRSGFVNSWRK